MAAAPTRSRPEDIPLLEPGPDASSQPPKHQKEHILSHEPSLTRLTAGESCVPKALHRRVLALFGVTFTIIIIVLAVLFQYSNKHDGLVSSDEKLHYLWTFGPTAVFTLAAAFWTKVEYHTKQVAPWRALSNGPSSARRTVLRDYISEWSIKSVFTSARSSDVDVALAITGGLLLQLLVVFSTALLALEQRTISREGVSLIVNSKFTESTGDISAHAFSKAMGSQLYSLSNPPGSTKDFAYQTLDVSQLQPNSTVTTTVDALHPSLDCKVVNSSWRLKPDEIGMWSGFYEFEMNMTEPDCVYSWGIHGYALEEIIRYNVASIPDNCRSSLGFNYTKVPGRRWWVWVSHVDLDDRNHTWPSYNRNITYRDGKVTIKTLACEPKLEMRKAEITTDGLTYKASLVSGPAIPLGVNISAWDMHASVLLTDGLATQTFRGTTAGPLSISDDVGLDQSLFIFMNATMPRLTPASWMDTDFLMKALNMAYQRVAVQVALEKYSRVVKETTIGNITRIENRLIVRPLSFYLCTSILVVLIAVVAALCFYRPSALLPRDPGSIAGLASIIASSSELRELLKDTGHSGTMTHSKLHQNGPFQSGAAHDEEHARFLIMPSKGISSIPKPPAIHKWWQPFALTIPGKLFVTLLPVLGIIILEILYQKSHHNQGITNVSDNRYSRYSWGYLPALMAWLVNSWVKNVYFNCTVIQPYHLLRHRPNEGSFALTSNPLSRYLVQNTWTALRKRQLTILLSSIAVLLGAILPIAVAGLYTPEIAVSTSTASLVQNSWFNSTEKFDPKQKYIPKPVADSLPQFRDPMPNMILYSNLSYPHWTYGPYVLSQVDFSDKSILKSNLSGSTLTALIPAVRGRANCSITRYQDVHYPGFQNLQSKVLGVGAFQAPMPERCVNISAALLQYDTNIIGRFSRADEAYNKSEIKTAADNASLPVGFVEFWRSDPPYKKNSSQICATEVTYAGCWPYVEQLMLNTTLSSMLFEILSVEPMPPDPKIKGGYPFFSDAEIVSTLGYNHGRARPVYWSNLLTPTGKTNSNQSTTLFDLFMEAVVWGKDGIPAEELVGRANEQRLLERVDDVYGMILAQIYNTQGRIRTAADKRTFNATIEVRNQFRVVQSLVATRILEAVLAAMLVCCVVVFFLLDMKELLPQNPCTIGAVASYVAASPLVDRRVMPAGSEFLSDAEMHKRGMFVGRNFSFGWHEDGNKRQFGIYSTDAVEKTQTHTGDTSEARLMQ